MKSTRNKKDRKKIGRNKKIEKNQWVLKGQQKMNVMGQWRRCWDIRWKAVKILSQFNKEWCLNKDNRIRLSKCKLRRIHHNRDRL